MKPVVVLITGALTCIGRASAFAFAREGACVVASGRHDLENRRSIAELRERSGEAEFFRADVRNEYDVRSLVDASVARFARNVDFVRELGADDVIDYGATPFETVVRDVDMVLDVIGGTITERSWSVQRHSGMLVTIVTPPSPQRTAGRAARGLFFIVEPSRTQLNELSRLIDAGTIRPIVEAVLPIKHAREPYERGIKDHPRGKLVLAAVGNDGGMSGNSAQ